MKIKAKIDFWISLLIWMVIMILIISIVIVPSGVRVFVSILAVPVLLFVVWIYLGTYYVLDEAYLLCKSGPFIEKIQYEKIKSVKLCENMLSSMALSRERIEIRQHAKGYLTGTTYISPIDRKEFLQDLISRCKNIEESSNK